MAVIRINLCTLGWGNGSDEMEGNRGKNSGNYEIQHDYKKDGKTDS